MSPTYLSLDTFNNLFAADFNHIQIFNQGDDQPPVSKDKIYVTNQTVPVTINLLAQDKENEGTDISSRFYSKPWSYNIF